MSGFNTFLCKVVTAIVNPLIILLAAAAFVYFLFGVAKFILDKSNGEEAIEGRNSMLWGIIGLAIIFGAYGIINFSISTGNSILSSQTPSYTGPNCSGS